jgi:hypothetical protein
MPKAFRNDGLDAVKEQTKSREKGGFALSLVLNTVGVIQSICFN